jgi:hypothetical protein
MSRSTSTNSPVENAARFSPGWPSTYATEDCFMPRFAANLSMLFTEVDFLDQSLIQCSSSFVHG